MHLFLVDQYIALDTISPIIYSLAKKEKVSLYNLNLFYNFKNEKVVKFLINQRGKLNINSSFIYKFFIYKKICNLLEF